MKLVDDGSALEMLAGNSAQFKMNLCSDITVQDESLKAGKTCVKRLGWKCATGAKRRQGLQTKCQNAHQDAKRQLSERKGSLDELEAEFVRAPLDLKKWCVPALL